MKIRMKAKDFTFMVSFYSLKGRTCFYGGIICLVVCLLVSSFYIFLNAIGVIIRCEKVRRVRLNTCFILFVKVCLFIWSIFWERRYESMTEKLHFRISFEVKG